MKNKKLNLEQLKVQSFVTRLQNKDERTVKGGGEITYYGCNSVAPLDCTIGVGCDTVPTGVKCPEND